MKIGFYFERFVIIVTSYHRDYRTESENIKFIDSFSFGILMLLIQGIIIAVFALGIFEVINKLKVS